MSERWQQSLLTLRPDFEEGARTFAGLRCLWAQWNRQKVVQQNKAGQDIISFKPYFEDDIRPVLDRVAIVAFRDRAETETWDVGEHHGGLHYGRAVRFYGNPADAQRFGELATAAGGCLAGYEPDYFLESGTWIQKPGWERYLWCRQVFHEAWKNSEGSPLRAQLVGIGGSNCNLRYSILPINPLLASVLLIDRLMDE